MKLVVDIHRELELFSLDAKFECDNEKCRGTCKKYRALKGGENK